MLGFSKRRTEIPEEVVMEILLRLPVKSLLRFRCVCKSWSVYIQSPQFIAQHHQHNLQRNNLNLLLRRCSVNTSGCFIEHFSALSVDEAENYFVSENIQLPFYTTRDVAGPCNGILCLQHDDKIALWNPSTREFKTLPDSTVKRYPFADDIKFGEVGFGFDSTTGDYKVVRLVFNCFHFDVHFQVELYSLQNNSWKQLDLPTMLPSRTSLFYNGTLYWKPTPIFNHGRPIRDHRILSFDLTKEEFSVSLVKFDFSKRYPYFRLVNFNGSLGAFVYPKDGAYIDFWVMNGSWIKQFRIEPIHGVDRPLGFTKNGKMFLESSCHELLMFDPVTRDFKNLGMRSYSNANLGMPSHSNAMQLIVYVESLVPINGRPV